MYSGRSYLAAYQHKKLNEIVIPGSHDAGIYTNSGYNVQTQAQNIGKQANSGCRFFDCRIATHKTKVNGNTTYIHKAYHLDGKLVKNHKVKGQGQIASHQTRRLGLGGWGGGLDEILDHAANFVQNNPTEFLILKFSKCYNWADIARNCAWRLDGHGVHYRVNGNLNTKTVQELAGHVITVFDESAAPALTAFTGGLTPDHHGIFSCKALFDKKTGRSSGYDASYSGLQYFGKFSSTDDIDKNTRKQRGVLENGAATHMDALGMMYWTTTAMMQNIRSRNERMWTQTNELALRETWECGLEASITSRFGREANDAMMIASSTGGALGGRLKSFMPNIVMMDFVNSYRCYVVNQLNEVAENSLRQLILPAPRGVQRTPEITA